MASNFFTFSFERSRSGRAGDLLGAGNSSPRQPSTPSAVPSSLPSLGRREVGRIAAGGLWANNAPGPGPGPAGIQPLNVADAQAARQRAMLLYMKRAVISRFRAWHRGLGAYSQWNEAREWYYFQQIPVPPRPGPFTCFNPPAQVQFPPLMRMTATPGVAHRRRTLGGAVRRLMGRVRRRNRTQQQPEADPRDVRAEQLEKPIAADFRPAGFTFRKRLGVGGQGAVYLLDMVADDGRRIPIVVKACVGRDTDNADALKEEKEAMMCLTGAHHAVQRVVLQGLPYPAPRSRVTNKIGAMLRAFGRGNQNQPGMSAQDNMQRQRSLLDNSNNIIIMEYVARGSVQDLIEKMETDGTRMSNRALWLVLECLFKACIGMAYPMMFAERGKDVYNSRHRQVNEVVPAEAAHQLPRSPVVHFDLDPQNALIGDFGPRGGNHEFVPSFKVADMGLAELIPQGAPSESDLWQYRLHGKPQIFAPEQFTEEWEYEASIDQARLTGQETAGNYQWWTNLYQVGWIMWSLITHAYPPVPPTMHWYEYPDPNAPDGFGGDGSGQGGVSYVPGLSYGGQVMEPEFDGYDMCLRTLIMRMLDHKPDMRPTMDLMEQIINQMVRSDDLLAQEPDAEFRAAMYRLFGEP